MHVSRLHQRRVRRRAAPFPWPRGEGRGLKQGQEQLWPHPGLREALAGVCDPGLQAAFPELCLPRRLAGCRGRSWAMQPAGQAGFLCPDEPGGGGDSILESQGLGEVERALDEAA